MSIEHTPSGQQRLTFADGTTYDADLIIGADGIRSMTRATVVGKGISPLGFANTHAYRGLVSIDALKAAGLKTDVRRPHNWVGIGQVSCFS